MTDFTDNKVLTEEEILENFKKFEELCQRLGSRTRAINLMLEDMGTRIATAPASSRKMFHAAYPGGLVDHSLRVARYALTLRNSIDMYESISVESVIFAALFHDFGKVGEPGADGRDYYVVQASEWHREKQGQYYIHNDQIPYMDNVDHTFYCLLHYGIKPSQEEYLAIRLNDGPYAKANRQYAMKEPKLALLIHAADRMACEAEKDTMR